MHRLIVIVTLVVLTGVDTGLAQLQGFSGFGAEEERISWEFTTDRSTVRPGEQLLLRWTAELAPGWHLYAIDSPDGAGVPLTVSIDENEPTWSQDGSFQQSSTVQEYDPFFKKEVRYFEDTAEVSVPVRLDSTASSGPDSVRTSVRYQICDDEMCLPPTTQSFAAAVTVESGDARSRYQSMTAGAAQITGGAADGGSSSDTAASTGLWSFLILAVGAGFAALLTPCVFPMIPLTVSFFTRHAGSRARATRMALVYGAAIVVTFTGLGVITALLVGAAGAQTIAANPWINLGIGLTFVVFALALLGLFELRLPAGVVNFFNRQGNERPGYTGVLFMGLTLTLVSFSCTAPFVGGLLAAAAQSQWTYPVVGMVGFSTAFSLPFVLFALFPNALEGLPDSGGWMNAVKVVLGFIELAAAFKFISNADLVWNWGFFSRPLVLAVWIVIFTLAGIYLLGKLPLAGERQPETVGTGRLMAAIGFLSLALYMVPGLFGAPLQKVDAYLPPRSAGQAGLMTTLSAGSDGDRAPVFDWYEEIEAARERAREVSKPIFIDFTGYTCTNCREMESTVFPQQPVAERFKNDFVLLRLYTDDATDGPRWQQYQLEMTGTVALPTYVIMTAEEDVLDQWEGMASIDEFETFLKTGIRRFDERQPLAARRR